MPKPASTGTRGLRAQRAQAFGRGAGIEPVGAGHAGEAHVVQVALRVVAQPRAGAPPAVVGAASRISARPCALKAARSSPASSGGRSTSSTPSTPAAAASLRRSAAAPRISIGIEVAHQHDRRVGIALRGTRARTRARTTARRRARARVRSCAGSPGRRPSGRRTARRVRARRRPPRPAHASPARSPRATGSPAVTNGTSALRPCGAQGGEVLASSRLTSAAGLWSVRTGPAAAGGGVVRPRARTRRRRCRAHGRGRPGAR